MVHPSDYSDRLTEEAFWAYCESKGISFAPSVLVAFSGGADSAVLLSLLDKGRAEKGYRLAALHVNHRIRKEEAVRDACFCETFCRERNIPFFLREVDVPALARREKLGLEEAARKARYQQLFTLAEEKNFAFIATAHNAADQAETLLFHLIRGSSLQGMSGMVPISGKLLRPLLVFSKDAIECRAKEQGIPFVFDSSNADIRYTRNYIRQILMPDIKKINPQAEKALLRFSEIARQDNDCLDRLAKNYKDTNAIEELAALDRPLLNRVLLIKIKQTANTELSEKHIRLLREKLLLAAEGRFAGRLSLPGRIDAVLDAQNLSFAPSSREKKQSHTKKTKPEEPLALLPEKPLVFETGWRILLSENRPPSQDGCDFHLLLPKKALAGTLSVRKRREGDWYRAGGMTRKIKKLLNEKKIPPKERDRLPFLCDEAGILFVPGLAPADRISPVAPLEAQACYHVTLTRICKEKEE